MTLNPLALATRGFSLCLFLETAAVSREYHLPMTGFRSISAKTRIALTMESLRAPTSNLEGRVQKSAAVIVTVLQEAKQKASDLECLYSPA